MGIGHPEATPETRPRSWARPFPPLVVFVPPPFSPGRQEWPAADLASLKTLQDSQDGFPQEARKKLIRRFALGMQVRGPREDFPVSP